MKNAGSAGGLCQLSGVGSIQPNRENREVIQQEFLLSQRGRAIKIRKIHFYPDRWYKESFSAGSLSVRRCDTDCHLL